MDTPSSSGAPSQNPSTSPTSSTPRSKSPERQRYTTDPYWGPDSARRRSLIDLLSFGLIADPWRELPWGWKWRSSPWFLTSLVAMGISTDILTYTIVVPVLPYRLQSLGYDNVANLTSYLLIGYSGGLTVATPFVSFIFHRYPYRRAPLLCGLVALQLSLVLFMLAQPFWCAVVARVLQGISSAIVWSVGMALICENVEAKVVGRQLGFAISGVSIGGSIGPVIGGVLYDRLGWYSPFIFCIIVCCFDFVGRVLLVERKELARWGIGMDGNPIPGWGEEEVSRDEIRESSEKINTGSARGATREDGERDLQVSPTPTAQEISSLRIGPTAEGKCSADNAASSPSQEGNANLDTYPTRPKELSAYQVLKTLFSSPRAVTGLSIVFCFALVIGSLDPVFTLRMQAVWDKNSLFVGLVYLAASIPTFFTGPIFGHFADLWGAEISTAVTIILVLPWSPLLILTSSLPGFIIYFTIWNSILSAVVAPVGQELAMVTKGQEGISELHQFGAFNMAFAIGTLVGPFIGGQIYDGVPNGWTILCWLWLAFMVIPLPFVLFYTGERPLFRRMFPKHRRKAVHENATTSGGNVETAASTA